MDIGRQYGLDWRRMKNQTITITENFVLRGQNVAVLLFVTPPSSEGLTIVEVEVTVYADLGALKFTGRGEMSVSDNGGYCSPPILISADTGIPAYLVVLTGDGFSYRRVWLDEIVINPVPIGHIDD